MFGADLDRGRFRLGPAGDFEVGRRRRRVGDALHELGRHVAFELVQHAELPWRYGRLYPVLVSPVFHSLHHSPERARHDSNYGKILSLWDFLFGTAIRDLPRPERTGVEGLKVPETVMGQLLAPLSVLRDRGARRP